MHIKGFLGQLLVNEADLGPKAPPRFNLNIGGLASGQQGVAFMDRFDFSKEVDKLAIDPKGLQILLA